MGAVQVSVQSTESLFRQPVSCQGQVVFGLMLRQTGGQLRRPSPLRHVFLAGLAAAAVRCIGCRRHITCVAPSHPRHAADLCPVQTAVCTARLPFELHYDILGNRLLTVEP